MLRSRLLFSVVFFLSIVLGILYEDSNIGFTIAYAMVLLFFCALVTILAAPRVIRVRERADQTVVFKGEMVFYSLSIANSSLFFYPRLVCTLHNADVVDYGEHVRTVGTVLPRQRSERDIALRLPFRGDYRLGIEALVVTDFLGLFRHAIVSEAAVSVIAYPESDEAFTLSIPGEPQNSSLSQDLFNEDYSSVADVRKYTSSDSLRKIHWQLSAGRGELIVKNFNSYEPDRIILFLDTKKLPLTGTARAAFEDKMAGYVAAASCHCIQGRLPATLVYGDGDADQAQLDAGDEIGSVFELLAGISFHREDTPLASAGKISGSYNMMIFLYDLSTPVHDMIRSLISFDHNITLYLFHSEDLPLTEEKEFHLESLRTYGAAIHTVDADEGRGSL